MPPRAAKKAHEVCRPAGTNFPLGRAKSCQWQVFVRRSVFLRYFLHAAKSTNPFSFRELRGFPNLDSARPNNNFPLTKLNPFAAFWRHCSCCCRNKSLPLRGFFRRLRRLSNFPFGKFVEVLQTSNQHTQTTVNLIKIRKIHINPLKISL